MSHSKTISELQELNLSYLMLVQKLIVEDRDTAIFRLKIDDELADLIADMSAKELTMLARQPQSLLQPNLGPVSQLKAILTNKRDTGMQATHLAMHMASA
ncbi:flagellar transcriptional activator FlhD [Pseudidiomarina maritima]|jgi:flagellar transcriptional activator FlhD|uniref:Flagellar transcriptional activator FlhD n=1 Tax=Pseudidiomarina maritima TaxID=519453 RepID=A0A1I6HMX0_9GAMM|nr:flagellar transcriptional regulator FlhD [Pseudidiomarina maritima]SFR55819.1 flagellar transcriptional activator FlhD [Pseudidiomarina maritima]